MLFEWQGILLVISQSGFSFDSVFFLSFTIHCCFMAILKTSADTNAGQGHRLTHCIKNLHCYYLKSLIFKHIILFTHAFKNTTQLLKTFFFVSHSLTNAISLPLIYSISSKHVSHFSARKKKKTWHFRFNFPHHTQAKVKSPPPGRPCKSNSPLPGNRKMVKCPEFARRGGCWSFDLIGAETLWSFVKTFHLTFKPTTFVSQESIWHC